MRSIASFLIGGALIASPALAQDAQPPAINTADTSAEATQGIGPGARPVGANWSRSPVAAANGMAATAQPLASQVAIVFDPHMGEGHHQVNLRLEQRDLLSSRTHGVSEIDVGKGLR